MSFNIKIINVCLDYDGGIVDNCLFTIAPRLLMVSFDDKNASSLEADDCDEAISVCKLANKSKK